MLRIKIEKGFKKDIAREQKSGQYSETDFALLKVLIQKLESEEEIDSQFLRHPLKGNLKGYEALHVKNDWLLVFKIEPPFLKLVMLGKHTQVYKKYK